MSSEKKFHSLNKTIIFFAFLSLIFFIGTYTYSNQTSSVDLAHPSDQTLSGNEYEKVRDELLLVMENESPKAALELLNQRMKDDDAILATCHELLHEIGNKSYGKYLNFGKAMGYSSPICISGYTHGVIEEYFYRTPNVLEKISIVCDEFQKGSFLSWECYHGTGHGFMFYYNNDLTKSIASCNNYNYIKEKSACANGAFMEHYNQKFEYEDFESSISIFDACKDRDFKDNCYANAPIQFLSASNYNYDSAIKWCLMAGNQQAIEYCYDGLGAQASRRNHDNPRYVESICEKAGAYKANCILGMIATHYSYNGLVEDVENLCPKLNKGNRSYCILKADELRDK